MKPQNKKPRSIKPLVAQFKRDYAHSGKLSVKIDRLEQQIAELREKRAELEKEKDEHEQRISKEKASYLLICREYGYTSPVTMMIDLEAKINV